MGVGVAAESRKSFLSLEAFPGGGLRMCHGSQDCDEKGFPGHGRVFSGSLMDAPLKAPKLLIASMPSLLGSIAHALDVLTKAKIYHRDLHPDNIWVVLTQKDGDAAVGAQVIFFDFGIATVIETTDRLAIGASDSFQETMEVSVHAESIFASVPVPSKLCNFIHPPCRYDFRYDAPRENGWNRPVWLGPRGPAGLGLEWPLARRIDETMARYSVLWALHTAAQKLHEADSSEFPEDPVYAAEVAKLVEGSPPDGKVPGFNKLTRTHKLRIAMDSSSYSKGSQPVGFPRLAGPSLIEKLAEATQNNKMLARYLLYGELAVKSTDSCSDVALKVYAGDLPAALKVVKDAEAKQANDLLKV